MKFYIKRKIFIGFALSFVLFTSLMVYRVFFYKGTFKNIELNKVDWSSKPLESDESWMNIFQNFKKIGFSHRILKNMGKSYQIHETTVMKINIMGMIQEIHIESYSTTDMDFAIKNFDFKIVSGSFNFSIKGEIKDKTLYIQSNDKLHIGSNQAPKPTEIVLENRPYLTSGVIHATLASGLKQDQKMIIFIFDPSTLGQVPVSIKMENREDIGVNGKKINAQKISLTFKGRQQFAWVDAQGRVLKERGLLDLTLVRTDRMGAIKGIPLESSDDLIDFVSIKSNKLLDNPAKIRNLTVKISGIDEIDKVDNLLNFGRQKVKSVDTKNKSCLLTIEKESIEGLPEKLSLFDLNKVDNRFKQPNPFIQSNDYRIKNFAFKAIVDDPLNSKMTSISSLDSLPGTPLEKVDKLVAWIQNNIKRQPVISIPNALSTLDNKMGDCNEHAALLAAFCRSIGIPAKIEAGVVYLNGSFYYHAWNSVFMGRWITVDSLFNQIPADVTHIAFSSGGQETQLNIIGLIGKVKIEVVDYFE